jgi:hypothetical protein
LVAETKLFEATVEPFFFAGLIFVAAMIFRFLAINYTYRQDYVEEVEEEVVTTVSSS